MSRTYRRTIRGTKRDWGKDAYFDENDVFFDKYPHRRKYRSDYLDHMNEPSWWIKEFMTRPARAKCRDILRKIKKGERDPEDTVYPDNRKPHIYYW